MRNQTQLARKLINLSAHARKHLQVNGSIVEFVDPQAFEMEFAVAKARCIEEK